MKYFLYEGKHLVPYSELQALVPSHHAFLQRGYDRGMFLFSGPHAEGGGFLLAKADSQEALEEFLEEEPFCRAGKMAFVRKTEFTPAQWSLAANSWFRDSVH